MEAEETKNFFFRNPELSALSFPTTTPPRINPNTHILAVCPITVSKANHDKDGWFLADFYAFNLLFKGLGASQTWLTAVDPEYLVRKYGKYVHGNPFEDRKVVLSEEILKNRKITPVTVVKSATIDDTFLKNVARVTEAAKQSRGSVLILVFSHGLEGYEFQFGGEKVSITRMQGALERYVPVCLMTTACYSGGWSLSTDINISTATAALNDNQSSSWTASQSISRYSGSVFASSIIDSLTSTTDDIEELLDSTDISDADQELVSLGQEAAKMLQTKTYMEFCKSSGRRMSTSIPLASFSQRWSQLETYPYTGSEKAKMDLDPSPNNPSFETAGPVRTGQGHQEHLPTIRSVNSTAPIQQSRTSQVAPREINDPVLGPILSNLRTRRIQQLVAEMKQTCPGDENLGYSHLLTSFMNECARTGQVTITRDADDDDPYTKEDDWNLCAIVQYRLTLARLAVYYIVDVLGLPRPNGETCLEWHKYDWERRMVQDTRRNLHSVLHLQMAQGRLWDYMRKYRFRQKLEPTSEQGPSFSRFYEYVIAAVFEARLENTDAEIAVMDQVLAIIAKHENHYERIARADPEVQKTRRRYLALTKMRR